MIAAAPALLLLLAASACALPAPAPAPLPRHVLTFPLPHAAVASIAPQFPGAVEDPALLLTTFAPVGKDSVVAVPRLSEALRTGSVYPVTLDSDAKWPNQAEFVPAGRAAQLPGPGVLVAGGFFVSPGKSTGAVSLLDLSTLPSHPRKMQLSTDKKGFFYHDAQWLAVEPGSARLDVVAARAQKPVIGKAVGRADRPALTTLSRPFLPRFPPFFRRSFALSGFLAPRRRKWAKNGVKWAKNGQDRRLVSSALAALPTASPMIERPSCKPSWLCNKLRWWPRLKSCRPGWPRRRRTWRRSRRAQQRRRRNCFAVPRLYSRTRTRRRRRRQRWKRGWPDWSSRARRSKLVFWSLRLGRQR